MKRNLLDIKGIKVGQLENQSAKTGVTVILTEKGAVCGVDVRGAAPGTRETDLLSPLNAMEKIHGLVLSGGSAFGLEAASGVMNYLEEHNIGFDVGCTKVPIVPQAVLFDLEYGDYKIRPNIAMGYEACLKAKENKILEGSFGAGCGATVGKLKGIQYCCKSGIGCWSETTSAGITVAVLVAVNAFGDIWENGKIIAGTLNKEKNEFINTEKELLNLTSAPSFHGKNTTIGIIATNAALTKAQATKIAGMAHDGLARCIRPIHTTLDGDTLFCISTCEKTFSPVPIDIIGTLAANVIEKAVIRAVKTAK